MGRVQATLEYHRIFLGEFRDLPWSAQDEYWRKFVEVRCRFIRVVSDCSNMTDEQVELTLQEELSSRAEAEVRHQVNRERFDTEKFDIKLTRKYYKFFSSIRICIQQGNCSPKVAASLFEEDMLTFLNGVCMFLENSHFYVMTRGDTEELAQFLLDNGFGLDDEDVTRGSDFNCNYLRETKSSKQLNYMDMQTRLLAYMGGLVTFFRSLPYFP